MDDSPHHNVEGARPEHRRNFQRSTGRPIIQKISTMCLMEASLLPQSEIIRGSLICVLRYCPHPRLVAVSTFAHSSSKRSVVFELMLSRES